ncbi:MAG TPA: methyltransferase domain-containing protein [Mycobacteriales bacterium]|nr:methyltransferase domain-containing protein [Mycobacteriales bacterium]
MTLTAETVSEQSADDVAQRLLSASLGAVDLLAVYLGDRLGWYRSLVDEGPATASELAERTGTHTRYAREWLEQQAVTGLLAVEADGAADPQTRRFRLPAGAAEVLTDRDSLAYLAPLGRMMAASSRHLPELLEAYRTGGGVAWGELGADARESQADMNRPWFDKQLPEALAGLPDLHARLGAPGARVADVGCGGGWASLALARAYPTAQVEGFDVDGPTVEMARANVAAAGLDDRVAIHHVDGAELPEDRFDVVFAFECLHDMPYPVQVLTAARRALRAGGVMVVMDEAVADAFTAPGDELERLMYGFSLLVCLPDGMSHPHSAGTGTVMRLSTLTRYAVEAGFRGVEVLPVQDFGFWRFYQLAP